MRKLQELSYWFQWQVPLCAVFIVVPAAVALNYIKREAQPHPLTSFHFWNPCWRNLNPLWLLIYRLFAFLILAFILSNMLSQIGVFAFYFYTQWTFALVMLYFALGSVISGYGCWMSTKKTLSLDQTDDKEEEEEEDEFKEKIKLKSPHAQREIHQKAGYWGHLMLAMYQTCAGACVLTDLVFWCLLVPLQANVQFHLTFLIGCLHSVNVVFLIGETALNGLPFTTTFGFAYFVLWSCLYISFQWLIHAFGYMTWWPYPFLELDTPWAPLWYLGMALFHVPCYWIYGLIVKAKHSFLPKLFPRSFLTFN